MLGWKPFCIHVSVVKGPLDFNFILQRDSIYSMNIVVSTLFRVMYFPHNGSIITIDHLLFINSNSCINLKHLTFLSVPNVRVDSFPPKLNYVVSFSMLSIYIEKDPLLS